LIVLTTSSGIYSLIFTPYLLTVGAACVFGIYLSVNAIIHKNRDAAFFLTGILLLSAGALLDTLNYMQIITISYVLSAALVGFIVLHVVLLAKKYSDAFRHSELLSIDLQISLDKLRNTETAFLSAQMKPHFLYNALTAIAEKCETDSKEAGRLIMSLSKYLRRTLDYDNLSVVVPIKKELELVQAYTSIECARFPNIEVVFNLPDPLPSLRLPPLTLQPLVENAIKHGLRKKQQGGHVVVNAKERENCMLFNVEDNGIGISEDVLTRLIDLPNGSVSIGLYNINTRLIRMYGKGINIKSEKGVGTRVSFEIPLGKET
jgi:sensor histidine kinase YesM